MSRKTERDVGWEEGVQKQKSKKKKNIWGRGNEGMRGERQTNRE